MPASVFVPHGGGRIVGLAERVRNLLVSPAREWEAIAAEPTTSRDIYVGYVAPLAGAAAVASFLGETLVGIREGFATVRAGVIPAFAGVLVGFAFAFVGVHLLARIAARIAARPGEDGRLPALRVVAYGSTPAWLAAILTGIPPLADLAWVGGLYALFLLFLGMRTVFRSHDLEACLLALVIAICAVLFAVVTTFVSGFANGALGLGKPTVVRGTAERAWMIGAVGTIAGRIAAESDADGRARMADAVGALFASVLDTLRGEQGAKDPFDQVWVTAAVFGAAGKTVAPVPPEALAPLLPPSLEGMSRVEATAGPDVALGMRGSTATARYRNGDGAITLKVTDAGEAAGFMRLYAWFDAYRDKTTARGYERKRRLDGHFLEEKYNGGDRSGTTVLLVDDRFGVRAEGTNVDDAALLAAVRAVDARKLASLARR